MSLLQLKAGGSQKGALFFHFLFRSAFFLHQLGMLLALSHTIAYFFLVWKNAGGTEEKSEQPQQSF